jgi:isoleucyl-tRNA synthetase
MTDLKETLNLPVTNFPMRANLTTREVERLAHWNKANLYHQVQAKNANGPSFILHDGPPFTNGDVHIGTALNKILKDIVVKYKSMKGFKAPFVPGWDCHGLPIEHKVMQSLIKERKTDVTIPELRTACEAFSKTYIEKLTGQFKRLGISADWDNAYKTLSSQYEASILRTFAVFVEKDLVYRSKKPVYWSIPCETALAEAEIEYKPHVSPSVWVLFTLPESECVKLELSHSAHIVIWTTTPWTLPANLAIALNPEVEYAVVACGTEQYIVASELVSTFAKECQLNDYKIIKQILGKALEGIQTQHPFIARLSPVVLGKHVTTQTGTGCVHTAPGHGLDDYLVALQYGLEIYSPLNNKGCYIDDGKVPAELVGASVLQKSDGRCPANEQVLELLKAHRKLLKQTAYNHSYPYCWRSKTPVIFRAMDQWFVSLDKHNRRAAVLDALSTVNWTPSWGYNRIRGAVESRPDWCISRQRSWGVPIPVFYDETGKALLDANIIRQLADKIEKKGTQFWFEASADELLESIALPAEWKHKTLTTGKDTLDVWIDSGCSNQAVLKQDPKLRFPADLYLEGSDQHRGWFQSSLWIGMTVDEVPPYKTVITHGFVVDEQKKKISKSDGKPQTADSYVEKLGADVLRLWIFSEDYKNDISISDSILSHVTQTYRTLRNTLRFQLGNLYDFCYEKDALAIEDLDLIDRWALHHTAVLVESVSQMYEQYEFHKAYQVISRFCSVTLSAIYHDILKDRLYTHAPASFKRRSSQTALYYIVRILMRILAPVLTFTADEAFCYAQGDTDFQEQSIHLESWPVVDPSWLAIYQAQEVESLLNLRSFVNEQLEAARQSKVLGQSLDAEVSIKISQSHPLKVVAEKHQDILSELFIVSAVTLVFDDKDSTLEVTVQPASGVRCPRSWRWVPNLVSAGSFGMVSPRCREALLAKYPNL